MKYKAIIFDFDDTLVESRIAKWSHHKHVAKKFYNIDLTDEDIREHWGKPLGVLIRELYKNSDTEENMYAVLYSVKKDFPKYPYKGAIGTIQKLLSNNIKVGVVSATTKRFLVEDLGDLGFPVEDFITIQGADETMHHKPDPRVFEPLINSLQEEGIKKEEILYVGDSIDDFKASTGAGIHYIALTTGLYSQDDFERLGALTICHNIEDIFNHIS